MTQRKINVLVVDDSKVAQMLLCHILADDPQIRVLGAVADGLSAVHFVTEFHPDVVLMDILMPGMDGFEATRRIMESDPVPIVICSGTVNAEEVATTFRVMEAGALACVEKPISPTHARFAEMASALRQTVRLMSEVKVVRRWASSRTPVQRVAEIAPGAASRRTRRIKIVGIGASTGGPPVLQTILAGLPKDFPVPILVVQHIARGFLPGLAEWLSQTTAFQVHIGSNGMLALPGHVYLAPDDFHMGVSASERIVLSKADPENGLRPAVAHLFRSLAEIFGGDAVGVLLTGMGRDGATELKSMKDAGAVTMAQDRESSVVHGMPGEAIALGGATHVLPAEGIAAALANLVEKRNSNGNSSS